MTVDGGDQSTRGRSLPHSAPGRRSAPPLHRTFDIDVVFALRCGGRFVLVALMAQPEVIARVLRHLGLPTGLPRTQRA